MHQACDQYAACCFDDSGECSDKFTDGFRMGRPRIWRLRWLGASRLGTNTGCYDECSCGIYRYFLSWNIGTGIRWTILSVSIFSGQQCQSLGSWYDLQNWYSGKPFASWLPRARPAGWSKVQWLYHACGRQQPVFDLWYCKWSDKGDLLKSKVCKREDPEWRTGNRKNYGKRLRTVENFDRYCKIKDCLGWQQVCWSGYHFPVAAERQQWNPIYLESISELYIHQNRWMVGWCSWDDRRYHTAGWFDV